MVDGDEEPAREVTRREALVVFASTLLSPSSVGVANASQAYPRLRRGINLFHPLSSPEVVQRGGNLAYEWPPFSTARHQLADVDLNRIKNLGFDFVRLPVDPSILIVEDGEHRSFLEHKIVEVVNILFGYGMNVIVDLHPGLVNPAYRDYLLVAAESSPVFDDYTKMVWRIAAALRSLPYDRVAFELFNEPPLTARADVSRWLAMLERLHRSAREAAPDLPLVLAGAKWDDRTTLMQIDVASYRDSNVLYTFHYYDPHVFTHQGVHDDGTMYVSGLQWPIESAQASEVFARAQTTIRDDPTLDAVRKVKLTAQQSKELSNVVSGGFDASRIAADFAEVGKWAKANGVAPERVLLGEFGCVIESHGLPLGASRLAWLETVRKTAEMNDFPWAYWAYKGYGGMELVDLEGRFHGDLVKPLGLSS